MPTTYKVLGQTTNSWTGTPAILNAVYDGEFYGPNTTNTQMSSGNWSGYNGQSTWQAASTVTGNRYYSVQRNTDGYSGINCYQVNCSVNNDSSGTFYLGQWVTGTPYATNYTPSSSQTAFVTQNQGKTIDFGFAWKYSENNNYDSANVPEMRIDWWKSTGYISSSYATASQTSISGNTWYKTSNTTATVPADATRMGIQIKLGFNINFSSTSFFARIDSVFVNLDGYDYSLRQDLNNPSVNATYISPFTGTGTETNVTATGTTANTTASAIGWASSGDTVTLYTVPAGTSTVVSSLFINNLSASASTYRVAVVPSGQTIATKHFITFDEAIAANSSVSRTVGLTLAAGDKIQIISPQASNLISAAAYGSEIS